MTVEEHPTKREMQAFRAAQERVRRAKAELKSAEEALWALLES